jgi:tRNA threonylcarbamoyladenosine biosynthesis protein TsaB
LRRLAIETATEACSVALFQDDRLIGSAHELVGRGHAERLIGMIADLPDRWSIAGRAASRASASASPPRVRSASPGAAMCGAIPHCRCLPAWPLRRQDIPECLRS